MKKKVLSILLLLVVFVGLTACGKKSDSKLDAIVKKFNGSETVKNYKDYGYEVKASATKDKLKVSGKVGDSKVDVEFKLDGNILSNDKLTDDEMIIALILIDSIGQTHGYKDSELAQNINSFSDEFEKYTLDKEGIELVIEDEKVSMKIDITKKIPLISMDNFYIKPDYFDNISEMVANNTPGNESGKHGNIAYDIAINDDLGTITIGQEKKLSDSAYKTVISALTVMYGEKVANHFQEIYPTFVDGKKTIEAFTIDTNYKVEDQENSVFDDTKVVHIIIDNSKIK